MALLAKRNETHHLALSMKLTREQVEKHDRWLNPRGLRETVIGLTVGPIADLERYVGVYTDSAIIWQRRDSTGR